MTYKHEERIVELGGKKSGSRYAEVGTEAVNMWLEHRGFPMDTRPSRDDTKAWDQCFDAMVAAGEHYGIDPVLLPVPDFLDLFDEYLERKAVAELENAVRELREFKESAAKAWDDMDAGVISHDEAKPLMSELKFFELANYAEFAAEELEALRSRLGK